MHKAAANNPKLWVMVEPIMSAFPLHLLPRKHKNLSNKHCSASIALLELEQWLKRPERYSVQAELQLLFSKHTLILL